MALSPTLPAPPRRTLPFWLWLHLCDTPADLPAPLPPAGDPISLSRETMAGVRHQAAGTAQAHHFPADRIDCLNTAVGEAVMNAVVHGGGGEAVIRADDEAIQVWITDQGAGIQIAELPRATLERGYSTKDSLGHGFWMMLRAADRVHLLTGGGGTQIVLTLYRQPVVPLSFAA